MKDGLEAIILAAGNSQRMGCCKFLLPMLNGLTFYENILIQFSEFGIKKITVVSQTMHLEKLSRLSRKHKVIPTLVINNYPEKGRFYSVQLGIKEAKQSEFTFIHNADAPFIDNLVLEKLYNSREKAEVVCPVFNKKGGHPILVNKKVKQGLLKLPFTTILKDALNDYKKINIDVENELITIDIDTKEDYEKYIMKK